ncbi:MAG: hypothetical protein LBN34_02775 [Clostridiales Family XIII bacterium]|jgi:hypothetical protein|nr:hypothetical protein [Clostridiales Family XIII bacterium]
MKTDMTIMHRIDLAVTILDSVTGRPVVGALRLRKNGEDLKYRRAPDGTILFINMGREDFDFEVFSSGYENELVSVMYGELSERLPALDVSLIPTDSFGDAYLTIDGTLPELAAVDAVRIGPPAFIVQGLDQKKCQLSVGSLYSQELLSRYYGIVERDETRFEPIEIIKVSDKGTYQLAKMPETQVSGLPLAYRVVGRVVNESCLLRLPNDGGNARWILRAATGEESSYRAFCIDDIEVGSEGKRIGIDAIMNAPTRDQREGYEQDAEAKGG